MNDMLDAINRHGFEYSLRREDGKSRMILWRPEWVTSDLYQSRVCPTFDANTSDEAVRLALEWVKEQYQ